MTARWASWAVLAISALVPIYDGGQYADRFRHPNFARQFPQGFHLERAPDRRVDAHSSPSIGSKGPSASVRRSSRTFAFHRRCTTFWQMAEQNLRRRPRSPISAANALPHTASGPCRCRHCRPPAPISTSIFWSRRRGNHPSKIVRGVPDRSRARTARHRQRTRQRRCEPADHRGTARSRTSGRKTNELNCGRRRDLCP